MTILRIDPLSLGKVLGALYAILGLIGGLIFAVFAILAAIIGGASGGGGEAALGGVVVAVFAVIAAPIIYGIMGFLFGLLGAFLYNVVASFVGGVRIETAP